MKANDFIEGLTIIQKNKPESESEYYIRAEHDQVFVGSLSWKMPKKDKKRLLELGWTQDEFADGWVASV